MQTGFLLNLRVLLASFAVFLMAGKASAQKSVADSSISMLMLRPSYAIQVPGGDLAERFGVNQSIGFGVTYKLASNWMFTLDGSFIFGDKIDEPNLFQNLTTTEGTIIGSDGLYSDIRAFERGYYVTLNVGRLFPSKKPNPNCGWLIEAGAGFMQHKIKIQDKKNSTPSLQGDYLQGYDRLTNGFNLRQFAGYMYVSNRRIVNFYAGIEMVQGFTSGKRDYYYNDLPADKSGRIDLLFGLRVGWIIALFREAPEKFYTY